MRHLCRPAAFVIAMGVGCTAETFHDRYEAAAQGNPPGVRFEVSVPTTRGAFRIGETIPVKLAFSSDRRDAFSVNRASYDRSGRLRLESYHVDLGAGEGSDPVADYYLSGVTPMLFGGLRTYGALSERPDVFDSTSTSGFDSTGPASITSTFLPAVSVGGARQSRGLMRCRPA